MITCRFTFVFCHLQRLVSPKILHSKIAEQVSYGCSARRGHGGKFHPLGHENVVGFWGEELSILYWFSRTEIPSAKSCANTAQFISRSQRVAFQLRTKRPPIFIDAHLSKFLKGDVICLAGKNPRKRVNCEKVAAEHRLREKTTDCGTTVTRAQRRE